MSVCQLGETLSLHKYSSLISKTIDFILTTLNFEPLNPEPFKIVAEN